METRLLFHSYDISFLGDALLIRTEGRGKVQVRAKSKTSYDLVQAEYNYIQVFPVTLLSIF